MLKTKYILARIEADDGKRISVMSRHTLNDGFTPHPRITSKHYVIHIPELGPPARLLGDYYKRGLPWEQFEKSYIEYIKSPDIAIKVQELTCEAISSNITLLCIEDLPTFCHRRLLAEECKRYQPDLLLMIM